MAGALGVVITTDVPMGGQHAQPVYVDDSLPIVGPAQAIVVTNGEIPQAGGPPLAVRLAPAGTPAIGPALPVYVVSGSLGGNAAPPSSLLTGLISYWKLDEASGTRNDSVGTNHLTDNNTVTQSAGRVGNAAQFTRANSESLSRASNASLQAGDIDFTLAAWVYLDSAPGAMGIIGKWTITGSQQEYLITHITPNFYFIVSAIGSGQTNLQSTFNAAGLGQWYFVVSWHDSVANTINIQVNNGTITSAGYSTGVFAGSGEFTVGRYNTAQFFDGRIDEVGWWKRVLTIAERTALYNGGSGSTHPFDLIAPLPIIVTDGDSLTFGTGSTGGLTYPNQLQALRPAQVVINIGVASATLTDMNSDAATQVDAAYDAEHRARSYVVCWGGTNDLYFGASAATTYSRLLTYLAARKAAGWHGVVVVTVLPRSAGVPPADFDTQRLALNALIRGDATKYDAIADVALNGLIGDAGDETNATYYTDLVHMTNAGYTIIAAAADAAIASIP